MSSWDLKQEGPSLFGNCKRTDPTCSTIDTAVYLARTNSWGAGGNRLYKYIPGNLASLSTPLATLPANQEFYGAGVRYDPSQLNLLVIAVQSGCGQN